MELEEVRKLIHGREICFEMNLLDESILSEEGIVVVFGYSDDNTEFRGAIDEEIDSYGGTFIRLTEKGLLENKCENDDCPYYEQMAKDVKHYIKPIWCEGDIAWTYETNIKHITFDIMENDEIFCRGLIFRLKDL